MKLRMEKAVYGGSSLARVGEGELAGKTAFVPLTLPGELVEAHISENKRGFLQAEADAVLDLSPFRTTPGCPYFGICGGCSYQHAVYAHQLAMKEAILRETLERAHLAKLPAIGVVSGEPWQYRNRIRLGVQRDPLALGYRERRSHRLLGIDHCPISAPLLEKAIIAVTDLLGSPEPPAFAELFNEVEFFTDGEWLLLSLFTEARRATQSAPGILYQALRRDLPELSGTGIFLAQGRAPARLVQTGGDGSLMYQAGRHRYKVSLGSFFQVNRYLLEPLVELVTGGRGGRLAWDLYAGVGLFARALAERFERVIAVETSPSSAADLRHNLKETSHRVVEAATLDFLLKHKASSTAPDLVVVDPPRAGLGPEITAALARIGTPEIVYVSCDPATLSRDLAALVESGYDLRTITMVDLFPQTFHLESVSVLTRR